MPIHLRYKTTKQIISVCQNKINNKFMSLCKKYVSANLPKTNSYYESVQKNTSQPIYRKQTGTKFKGDYVKGKPSRTHQKKNVARNHAKPNKMHKHLTQTTKIITNSCVTKFISFYEHLSMRRLCRSQPIY